MPFSPQINALIDALRCLPSVGQKSAQRMAFHLLDKDQKSAQHLAKTLTKSLDMIGRCQTCRTLCESDQCQICSSSKRNQRLLCIVETPMDILAIEQSSGFDGIYFVLMGRLSPLDGIGPEELQLDQLEARLKDHDIDEVILATNPTIEGEATAYYLTDMIKSYHKPVSRIAYGVPFGGELEYIDSNTLSHAFHSRQAV